TRDVTDPSGTIRAIEFWYTNYAKPHSKEVIVTENGFSSITEVYPDITREDWNGKYAGTEAQQQAYFSALFQQLMEKNASGGLFDNKLRGFHVWSILDNDNQAQTDPPHYLGLHRLDTPPTPKPATDTVRTAIGIIEADHFHRPFVPAEVDGTNLWSQLHKGLKPVDLRFTEGDDHDFLHYVDTGPGSRKKPMLTVT